MTGTDVTRFTHKSVPVIFEPPCMFKKYVDFSDFMLKLDTLDPSHMLSKFFRLPSSAFQMTLTVHTFHLNVIQITGLQFSCESFQQNSHNTFTHNGDA